MKRFQFQVVSREKKSEGVRLAGEVKLKFPAVNSLTETDRRYFEMIRSEGDWGSDWENSTTYQSQVSTDIIDQNHLSILLYHKLVNMQKRQTD